MSSSIAMHVLKIDVYFAAILCKTASTQNGQILHILENVNDISQFWVFLDDIEFYYLKIHEITATS